MAELLGKKPLICTALEDYYVKSEFYKPNCKSAYHLSIQEKFLCYVNASGETNYHYHLLLSFNVTP